MKVAVHWLSLHEPEIIPRGYWDQALLEDMFEQDDSYKYTHSQGKGLPKHTGAIVIIPARHHAKDCEEINKKLSKLEWCLVILAGDEGSVFPSEKLSHPNMKLWVMSPVPGVHDHADRFTFNGYAPDYKMLIDFTKEMHEKPDDWFFSGQVTHPRREEAFKYLSKLEGGDAFSTDGFSKGLGHKEYYRHLARAKIAPCPSGPETPDSFRLYEALEAGCIPIAEERPSREGYPDGFWENLFREKPPFPVIQDWTGVDGVINQLLRNFTEESAKVSAWWKELKVKHRHALVDDISELANFPQPDKESVTTLIPTSPIPRHPETAMIETTIESVRERDDGEIIIMADGVRKEQSDRRLDYYEHLRRLSIEIRNDPKVYIRIFSKHTHQAGMTRECLDLVRTDYLMFVEHDTPLIDEISMVSCKSALEQLNVVRFCHEAIIPEPHMFMMMDDEPRYYGAGAYIIRTYQWSQRPHIARTDFYRYIIYRYYGRKAVTMIEEVMYGILSNAYETRGIDGWNEFKVGIYANGFFSKPPNLKRSDNLDGREDDVKYPMKYDYEGEPPEGAPK